MACGMFILLKVTSVFFAKILLENFDFPYAALFPVEDQDKESSLCADMVLVGRRT